MNYSTITALQQYTQHCSTIAALQHTALQLKTTAAQSSAINTVVNMNYNLMKYIYFMNATWTRIIWRANENGIRFNILWADHGKVNSSGCKEWYSHFEFSIWVRSRAVASRWTTNVNRADATWRGGQIFDVEIESLAGQVKKQQRKSRAIKCPNHGPEVRSEVAMGDRAINKCETSHHYL